MKTNHFNFISGIELPNKTILIAAEDNNIDLDTSPHTILLRRTPDGKWNKQAHTRWISAGISYNSEKNGIALISPWGRFVNASPGKNSNADLIEGIDKEYPITVFRFLKNIDGKVYAGGTNYFLFQEDKNNWKELSHDLIKLNHSLKSFENLTGFNEKELYGFGWSGLIFSNSEGSWKQIKSPTKLILNDGDVHNNEVFIGGNDGIILKGRKNKWTIIENKLLTNDIWSVRKYGDAVYFSTLSGILKWKDNKLSIFKQLNTDMHTSMFLFTGPSGLWSVGTSDIALFDGENWQTIVQKDSILFD